MINKCKPHYLFAGAQWAIITKVSNKPLRQWKAWKSSIAGNIYMTILCFYLQINSSRFSKAMCEKNVWVCKCVFVGVEREKETENVKKATKRHVKYNPHTDAVRIFHSKKQIWGENKNNRWTEWIPLTWIKSQLLYARFESSACHIFTMEKNIV